MFNFFGKTDKEIQEDVENELRWDPCVNDLHMKVSAEDGVVTLRGNAQHFFDKTMAEEIALGVGGVTAVANEIEVILMNEYLKSDEEIAHAAIEALKWDMSVPKEGIQLAVSKGFITLTGETEWNYQRTAAFRAVKKLMGVVGVNSEITLKKKIQSKDVKLNIEEALKRSAEAQGRDIGVTVDNDRIILSGRVHSLGEAQDAALAAWNAPGVRMVENNIKIAR